MAHEFRGTEFMSAAEKSATLRAWVRFLKSDMRFDQFTKALYNHLIQHCSFIAHYDRAGFYGHYFETGDTASRFLSQFDARGACASVEYGAHHWLSGDYEDINRAMIAEAAVFVPALLEASGRKQKAADIAIAVALLTKHGLSLERNGTQARDDQVTRQTSNASTPLQ